MILAIDIGNLNTIIGGLQGSHVLFSEQVSTDLKRTDLEYIMLFRTLLELYGRETDTIDGAIIASVVPPITAVVSRALEKYFEIRPMIVGPGLKNGLSIRMDVPSQVGAGLVVNAVAGLKHYGSPLIILDFGTATSISVLDEKGQYSGGILLPGPTISLEALVSSTSQLQRIPLEAPSHVLGKNTVDSMKSGVILGHAAAVDGMIDRLWDELGYQTALVATGELAARILPYCCKKIHYDPDLSLKGMSIIYEKNKI